VSDGARVCVCLCRRDGGGQRRRLQRVARCKEVFFMVQALWDKYVSRLFLHVR
jgi:hypothetical protein